MCTIFFWFCIRAVFFALSLSLFPSLGFDSVFLLMLLLLFRFVHATMFWAFQEAFTILASFLSVCSIFNKLSWAYRTHLIRIHFVSSSDVQKCHLSSPFEIPFTMLTIKMHTNNTCARINKRCRFIFRFRRSRLIPHTSSIILYCGAHTCIAWTFESFADVWVKINMSV